MEKASHQPTVVISRCTPYVANRVHYQVNRFCLKALSRPKPPSPVTPLLSPRQFPPKSGPFMLHLPSDADQSASQVNFISDPSPEAPSNASSPLRPPPSELESLPKLLSDPETRDQRCVQKLWTKGAKQGLHRTFFYSVISMLGHSKCNFFVWTDDYKERQNELPEKLDVIQKKEDGVSKGEFEVQKMEE